MKDNKSPFIEMSKMLNEQCFTDKDCIQFYHHCDSNKRSYLRHARAWNGWNVEAPLKFFPPLIFSNTEKYPATIYIPYVTKRGLRKKEIKSTRFVIIEVKGEKYAAIAYGYGRKTIFYFSLNAIKEYAIKNLGYQDNGMEIELDYIGQILALTSPHPKVYFRYNHKEPSWFVTLYGCYVGNRISDKDVVIHRFVPLDKVTFPSEQSIYCKEGFKNFYRDAKYNYEIDFSLPDL